MGKISDIYEARKKRDDNLFSKNGPGCFFGEHLLPEFPYSRLNIVENPQAALLGALFSGKPKQSDKDPPIWLAVGDKNWLSQEMISLLLEEETKRGAGSVTFFPSLSIGGKTFNLWKQIAGGNFVFSDLLERIASKDDREKEMDIAHFFLSKRLTWNDVKNDR